MSVRREGRFLNRLRRGRAFSRASWLLVSVLGWSFSAAALTQFPLLRAPRWDRGAVTSENATATREALRVLREGGNAADAAVVAALVAGVTTPTSSGLGGGGFALTWEASAQRARLLDFRETAPAELDPEPFEERPLPREKIGALVGVPGEAKGLYELHRLQGKLPWSQLVRRAEERARQGFPVSPHVAKMLAYAAADLKQVPGLAGLYFPGGKPAVQGALVRNPALAETLRRLRSEGPQVLYEGPIAEEIVEVARAHGSKLRLEDFAAYQVKEREPLRVPYEDYEVLTMPLPSAGGFIVAQTLGLFPAEELRRLGHGSPAYQHWVAEGLRAGIADRMRYLGDGDFEQVSLEKLLAPERLAQRRASLALDRTHALPRFGLEGTGTHHLITADREGNVVSLTTTVNRLFGAKLHAERSGIILNDELDDFTQKSAVQPFGLTESPNRPRPFARPLSSMTPTLVLQGGAPVLAVGGSGGPAIATNVTQALLGALVFGQEPAAAVSAPRFYIPSRHATIWVEQGTSEEHRADLEWRGEIVGIMRFTTTAVQMLRMDGGRIRGGADPRKSGEAGLQ